MSFILHSNVALWLAPFPVMCEETAVTTLKDVNLWVMEFGVLVHVETAVAIAEMKGPGT